MRTQLAVLPLPPVSRSCVLILLLLCLALLRPAWGYEVDLFTAAQTGDIPRLRAILDADPGLRDLRRKDGFTALELAANAGQSGVVDELLRRGATADFIDHTGRLYLISLMHSYRWAEALAWAQRGASLQLVAGVPPESGWQVLLTQATTPGPPGEDMLVMKKGSPPYVYRHDFELPRARHPSNDWWRLLVAGLENRTQLDSAALETRTAVGFAIWEDRSNVLQTLFDRGAKITWEDVMAEDHLPAVGADFFRGSQKNRGTTSVLLQGPVDPRLLLPLAVDCLDVAAVERLYARGGTLDFNLLAYPAEFRIEIIFTHDELLRVVLRHQPDFLRLSQAKVNLIEMACQNDSIQQLQFLWDHDIRPERRLSGEMPELESAVKAGHWNAVRFLLDHGGEWRGIVNHRNETVGLVPNLVLNAHLAEEGYDGNRLKQFHEYFYQPIQPLPPWVLLLTLLAVLWALERWRLWHRRHRAAAPSSASGAVVPSASALPASAAPVDAEWGQREHLAPDELALRYKLIALQADARSRLRSSVINLLFLVFVTLLDPYFSQVTVEMMVQTGPARAAERWFYEFGPGSFLLFLVVSCFVPVALVLAGLAHALTGRGARFAWLAQTVAAGVTALLAAAMTLAAWNWIGSETLVVLLGFQTLLAIRLGVDAFLAWRRQCRLVEQARALQKPLSAAQVNTDLEVPEGWDEKIK